MKYIWMIGLIYMCFSNLEAAPHFTNASPGVRKDIGTWKVLPKNGITQGSIELRGKVKIKKPSRSFFSLISRHEGGYTCASATYLGGAMINGVEYKEVGFSGYPIAMINLKKSTYLITITPFITEDGAGYLNIYYLDPSNQYNPLVLLVPTLSDLQAPPHPDVPDIHERRSYDWKRIKDIHTNTVFEKHVHRVCSFYSLLYQYHGRILYAFYFDKSDKEILSRLRDTINFLTKTIAQSPDLFFISRNDFEKEVGSLPKSYQFPPRSISFDFIKEIEEILEKTSLSQTERKEALQELDQCCNELLQLKAKHIIDIPSEYQSILEDITTKKLKKKL